MLVVLALSSRVIGRAMVVYETVHRSHDENIGLPQLDFNAAFADTKPGRTIGLASSEARRASTLEEAGTRAG